MDPVRVLLTRLTALDDLAGEGFGHALVGVEQERPVAFWSA